MESKCIYFRGGSRFGLPREEMLLCQAEDVERKKPQRLPLFLGRLSVGRIRLCSSDQVLQVLHRGQGERLLQTELVLRAILHEERQEHVGGAVQQENSIVLVDQILKGAEFPG